MRNADLERTIDRLVQDERHLAAARLLRQKRDPSVPLSEEHRKLLTNAEIIE